MYKLAINIENINKIISKTKDVELKEMLEDLIEKGMETQPSASKEKARREALKDLAVKLDKEIIEYNESNEIFTTNDMNDNAITFQFGDSTKKLFLRERAEIWETESSLNYAFRVLDWVSEVEEVDRTPIYMADTEKVSDIIPILFNEVSYYGMRFRVKVFMELQKFLSKQIKDDIDDFGWEVYFKSDKFRDLFSVDSPITKDELMDLFNITKNAQDGIIPLLIFEGVNLSRVEEKDEIRYLKQSDIGVNEIRINHSKNAERVIDIDNETQKAIASVIAQKFILTNKFGNDEIKELDRSDYLLRVVRSKGKSENKPLTYRGAYSRLVNCFENYENNISHKSINPKTIKLSGQYYYITKYMKEGYTLQEAMRMTLKRFGDWFNMEDKSKEASHMLNRQKMNRLKKKWQVYNNIIENSN